MEMWNKKILVAYFSHKGQNYAKGEIVELEKGNTEIIAEQIAAYTGADLFEIKTVKKYPFEYKECTVEAKKEQKEKVRPKLENEVELSDYDIIFLGYPNWWGTMPMAVWTFLESNDFAGKVIYPFCIHEGSGMGESENDLKKLVSGAEIKPGFSIYGSSVERAEKRIKNWLEKG